MKKCTKHGTYQDDSCWECRYGNDLNENVQKGKVKDLVEIMSISHRKRRITIPNNSDNE